MTFASIKDLAILVVSNKRDVLDVIERLLGHLEVKAKCVTNTDSGLAELRGESYDIVIIDRRMKVARFEFSRTVRQLFPALNIVSFEGNTTSQVMNLFLDPKVLELSEEQYNPCSLGDMLASIRRGEKGKTYLLKQTSTR